MADRHPKFPIVLSILAAVATLALKSAAAWLTDSVGLLSDAIESGVNLIAATTALFCLWYASLPVDTSHTYGHAKIEYFSSGVEGILILVAAAGIAWYAVFRLLALQPLEALGVGTVVALVASLINLGVARVLLRVGRERGSIILEADGQHLMTDVWTSFAVVSGLFLVWLTGWTVIDPIVALMVAANILWTGLGLVRRSFDGLMDHSLPMAEQAAVRSAVEAHLKPGLHYHALRTRRAGARRFADFHLLVPGDWSVKRAHDLAGTLEDAVQAALPGIEVYVHIEPIEEPAAWRDSALLGQEPAPGEKLTS
jgi:cation diffusion facilitator family transporter